jgi:hypothetical protein
MSWNNRIFKHTVKFNGKFNREDRVWYGIHETYYDDDGKPDGWTAEPMCGGFDSVDDLIVSLEMMLRDAKKYRNDVLEYKDDPASPVAESPVTPPPPQ